MIGTIAYDCTLRRPGCVLVQAAFGATVNVLEHFNDDDWLLAPTDDMQVYTLTSEAQLERLKEITAEAGKERRGE